MSDEWLDGGNKKPDSEGLPEGVKVVKRGGEVDSFSGTAVSMFWIGFACTLISSLTIFFGDYFWSSSVGSGQRVISFAAMFKLATSLFIGVSLMIFSMVYDIRVYMDKSTKS